MKYLVMAVLGLLVCVSCGEEAGDVISKPDLTNMDSIRIGEVLPIDASTLADSNKWHDNGNYYERRYGEAYDNQGRQNYYVLKIVYDSLVENQITARFMRVVVDSQSGFDKQTIRNLQVKYDNRWFIYEIESVGLRLIVDSAYAAKSITNDVIGVNVIAVAGPIGVFQIPIVTRNLKVVTDVTNWFGDRMTLTEVRNLNSWIKNNKVVLEKMLTGRLLKV
jgi:hypothetical protein